MPKSPVPGCLETSTSGIGHANTLSEEKRVHQYNDAADTGRTKCEDVKGPSLQVQPDKNINDMKRSRWIATYHFQRLAWSD